MAMRKDPAYARKCVALYEAYYRDEIDREEFKRRLAALKCGNNVGPEKPEKQLPPALLPGLDGVPRA